MVELNGKVASTRLIFQDLRCAGVAKFVRVGVAESVAMKITGHNARSVLDCDDITSRQEVKNEGSNLKTYLVGQNGANSGRMSESVPTSDLDKSLPIM